MPKIETVSATDLFRKNGRRTAFPGGMGGGFFPRLRLLETSLLDWFVSGGLDCIDGRGLYIWVSCETVENLEFNTGIGL